MDVFVDTIVSSFSIEVGFWDTVLMIKQKIEKFQGVPVSKQYLFFQGKILQDHRHIIQCHILQNSRLFLATSPDDIPNRNNDQVLHQTKHSPASSYSTQQIIHGHRHWPVSMRSNNSQVLQTKQSPAPSNQIEEFLNNQGWPLMGGSNNDQVLHQTKHSPAPSYSTQQSSHGHQHWPVRMRSNSSQVFQTKQSPAPSNQIEGFLNNQGWPLMGGSNNDQMLHQTKHSPAPSYSTEQSSHGHQHWPVRMRSNSSQVLQTTQSPAPSNQIEGFLNNQGWPLMGGSNNDQVLQTEKTQVSLDSIDEFLGIQDSPPVASDSVGETIDGQDSSVMVRGNYNELRSFSEIDELVGIQPVTVGSNSNTNQVVRPLGSYSVKEIINIPDSPVKKKIKIGPKKMTVMVMPFKENRRIPVEVNERDNVKELRKELVKMQERGQINLPQERYLFIHKQDVLEEDQSFRRNLVADGDTIEIFEAYIVRKASTTTIVRFFGH